MYTIYYYYLVPLWLTNFPITIQRRNFYYTEYSSLYVYHNHLEGLLNYGLLDPTPRISNSVGLDEAWEFTFLTCSQVVIDASGFGTTLWELLLRCTAELHDQDVVTLKCAELLIPLFLGWVCRAKGSTGRADDLVGTSIYPSVVYTKTIFLCIPRHEKAGNHWEKIQRGG